MNFWEKLGKIDRRIIFALIGIGVIVPLIVPIGLPEAPSPYVISVYDFIENLPEGSNIIVSFDYDASVLPEVHPMAYSLLRHAFSRGVKVIGLSLNPAGVGLGVQAFNDVAKEYNKVYGEDYAYLGFKPDLTATMLGFGEEIRIVSKTDYFGTLLDSIPVLKDVHNYEDIALVITLAASSIPESWITNAYQRYGQKIACGVTAVMAADFYPFLQTGQLIGMLGGMKGAAEYEELIHRAGYTKASRPATQGMDANSVAHILIIIFIIMGNISFFVARRRA